MMGPMTRQRTWWRSCTSIGVAAIPSSSSTTGTARSGPSNSANGGDITIAPPKPVMPRITPASAATTAASARTSGAKESTVDGDGLAGDEPGAVRGEEHREARDVVAAREPAERDAREDLLAALGREELVHHLGVEHGRRDGVHADAERPQLAPEPARHRHHRGLGRPDRKSTRLNSSHGYISYAVF